MEKCRKCGIVKDDSEYSITKTKNVKGEKVTYINRLCRDCRIEYGRLYNKTERRGRKILTPEEKRKYQRDWRRKKAAQIKAGIVPWYLELYNYIEDKNIFTDDELVFVKELLRKIDMLGNEVKK